MENRETSNIYFGDHTRRQMNRNVFTSESRILDMQRAKRALIIKQTETVCAVADARKAAVMKRLGVSAQHDDPPSSQPPAFPGRNPKSSLAEDWLSPPSQVPHLNVEDGERNQRSPESLEDDDSFWDAVTLGAKMAALACKEAQVTDRDESPTPSVSPVSSLSSVDAQTPRDLRDVPLIESSTFKPTPPLPRADPPLRRRASRLPVSSAKLSTADKEVADGFRLQEAKNKLKAGVESVQPDFLPSPQTQAPAKKTPTVTPMDPTPPTVPQTKRSGSRPRKIQHPAKAVAEADKMTASDRSLQTANDKMVAELQPLSNPAESLSLFFKLLSSDYWVKKTEGLKIMRALAQHHSETLKTKLHEVCLVIIEEVNNLRSSVACAAMETLAELYVHLQKAMDPEVEGTGRALLLKLAQTSNAFIHEKANIALDAMVQNCSCGRIVTALLNTGLSHRCVAVRGSIAQHLHMLADSFGATHLLTAAGRSSTERLLTAVSKMCVDAAPEVRHYGQAILHELSLHRKFLNLWTKIVPDKERMALDKILRKTK